MSELTLTLMRLGLLVLLWFFVFSIVGVLRSDLYGTRISRRTGRAQRKARAAPRPPEPKTPTPSGRPARGAPSAPVVPTTLVVTEGRLAGTSLPLRQSGVLIGRNPECTLVLDDDFASGRHARLSPQHGGWVVEDLGSTNGTHLDGTRLTGAQPVTVGSHLQIGRTVLELRG